MEIVIDIPEDLIDAIKEYCGISIVEAREALPIIVNAIHDSTPIPKGHGRLIDADAIWDIYHSNDYDFYEALDDAPTIIEADKE